MNIICHMENLDSSIREIRQSFAKNEFDVWTDDSIKYFESLSYFDKKKLLRDSKKLSDKLIFEFLYKDDILFLIDYCKRFLGLNIEQIKCLLIKRV